MEVIRVVLLLALCSLTQGLQLSKKWRVIDQLPNDQVQLSVTLIDSFNYLSQDSMETKMEMILTILSDQQTAISDQKAKISDLQEIVQRQELKIAELERRIEPSESNGAQRSLEKESKVALYRSCEELRSVHPESGGYWIDPDGVATGDPPIFVQCNMTTGPSPFIEMFLTDFDLNRIHFDFTQQRRVDTSGSLRWSRLLLEIRHLQRHHAANGGTNAFITILSPTFQIRLLCGAIRVQ
jgi:hypothetical protein